MDNKIILELIKKDLEEIKILIEALEEGSSNEQILIDITNSKAKTLVHEISLLKGEKKNEAAEEKIQVEEKSVTIEEEVKPTIAEEILPNEKITDTVVEKIEPVVSAPINDPIESELEKEEDIQEEITLEKEEVEIIPEKNDSVTNSEPELPLVDEKQEELLVKEAIVQKEIDIEESEVKESKILGENFTKEPSLNERFASVNDVKTKVAGKPVSSIKGAIGINDKFMFSRELFENNQEKMNATIDALDQAGGLMEAIEYLENNFQWQKNETSLKFMELVKRRYEN